MSAQNSLPESWPATHIGTIVLLVVGATVLVMLVIQWRWRILAVGRFHPDVVEKCKAIRDTAAVFITKVVDDFRHLLALVLVLTFLLVLVPACVAGFI